MGLEQAKIMVDQQILKDRKQGDSLRVICKRYGKSVKHVKAICGAIALHLTKVEKNQMRALSYLLANPDSKIKEVASVYGLRQDVLCRLLCHYRMIKIHEGVDVSTLPRWKKLRPKLKVPKTKKSTLGQRDPAVLSRNEEIKQKFTAGSTVQQLCDEYFLEKSTVNGIVRRLDSPKKRRRRELIEFIKANPEYSDREICSIMGFARSSVWDTKQLIKKGLL